MRNAFPLTVCVPFGKQHGVLKTLASRLFNAAFSTKGEDGDIPSRTDARFLKLFRPIGYG